MPVSCHFCRSYLKANKISKSEEKRKVEYGYNFESVLMLFTQSYQNQYILDENTTCQAGSFFEK